MRYDARRFQKALRSISAQAATRSKGSPRRKRPWSTGSQEILDVLSGLNWSAMTRPVAFAPNASDRDRPDRFAIG